MLEAEQWKHGADMAYSVIYEHGLDSILRHCVAVHEEFMVPANVSVVAGQMGRMLNMPGTPYHMTRRRLEPAELRKLVAEGWTISSHGMTGADPRGALEKEVAASRGVLQDAVGADVTAFVVPRGAGGLVRLGALARQSGYLCMFSCLDHVNEPGDGLFCLGRVPLMQEGPGPWFRQFDPYDRLMLAKERHGWVVDSLVCASHEPLCLDTEITISSLVRRLEKVREVGGNHTWCAVPEEVADYILTRRATRITPGKGGPDGNEYMLSVSGLDASVRRRVLTFRVSGLRDETGREAPLRNLTQRVDIQPIMAEDDSVLFEVEAMDGLRLRLPDA